MLITVMMTGVVAVVIAAAIIVSFRTFPDVEARADTAITLQGLTTWLPPDVDSANPGEFEVSDVPSGCAGADPGVNLLRLKWEETAFGTTTNYVVSYRFVASGDTSRIKRVACSGQPTLGLAKVRDVTGSLPSTPPTVAPRDTDSDGLDDAVVFSIVTLAGNTVRIDAVTKNPHVTLPPPPAPTVPTTTTTTTAVNAAPTAADTPTAFTTELTPVVVTLPASDPNGDLLVTTVSGFDPLALSVTVDPVDNLQVTIEPLPGTLAGSSFTFPYTVTDPGGLSATATVTVEVTAFPVVTTTTTTTTTTTIPPPCVLGSITMSHTSMALKFAEPSKLKSDVTIEITVASGYCVGLWLEYDSGGPNALYIQNFGTSAPYIVTLDGHPHGTELWSLGAHVLTVRDGANNLLGTSTLTTTT
jgi:hypothetical protein